MHVLFLLYSLCAVILITFLCSYKYYRHTQCFKITEKVSFNIASEAVKQSYQTLFLIRQKLVEMQKLKKQMRHFLWNSVIQRMNFNSRRFHTVDFGAKIVMSMIFSMKCYIWNIDKELDSFKMSFDYFKTLLSKKLSKTS